MADNEKNVVLHIVMFPWLAFGHMIPFLELSKYLARRGHRISFVSTPRNLQRLPKIPSNLSNLINFVGLPLPRIIKDHNLLPSNAEATSDITFDKIQYLKIQFDGLIDTSLSKFLETSSPDWIFCDFPAQRLSPIAAKLDIPCAYFCTGNASALAFCAPPSIAMCDDERSRSTPEDFTVPPKWVTFPTNIVYRYYEAKRWLDLEQNASRAPDSNRMGSALLNCQVIFVRSYTELEGEWLNLLQEVHKKPVIPVGMLPPSSNFEEKGDEEEDGSDEWMVMREWLDKQKEKSVIYVAFGSEVTLSREDLNELAFGLELSELPFFWAMRRPHGSTRQDDSTGLPDGFEDRVKDRGFIRMGWVPQLRILGHPSVGCFVTHCGWSSILEGLVKEKALVLLPMLYDQGLVARLVVEKKLGLEIQRDERDGSFTRDSVVEALKAVMVEEEGEWIRTKAREMKKIIDNMELQNKCIDNIERFLIDHRRERDD
ncbi:UDP-glucuronosyl/UDP-glucosyltransferase [Macleaya cordata]|uniref:UDP-glucuronosyl/UDP-glucosyltransferase n=1 Tax=Macleaya cordata TaxID=56857 RepID=A0A200PUF0_MACCD|nr:UDP-glucuronosyl/UDP-glucosyltransferase [Macleaya cordata]